MASGSSQALLEGLVVLELGTGPAVAYCGKLFVDCGASVIKIEDPAGGDLRNGASNSARSAYLNAGKDSVALDLSLEATRVLVSNLANTAGIVIVGKVPFGRGVLETWLAADRGCVVVYLTPFGLDGPYAGYSGSDLTALAGGGMMHMIGDAGRPPLALGGQQGEYSTGASGFTGALFAYFDASQHGVMRVVDANGLETAAYMEWKAGIYEQTDGIARSRGAQSQWVDVLCSDGLVGFVYENRNWPQILDLIPDDRLNDPRFATRDGRIEHNAALTEVIQDWAAQFTKAEAYDAAQKAGVPVGLVANVADLMASPQYVARKYFQPVTHPDLGKVQHPSAAWTVDGTRPVPSSSQTLGQSTETILAQSARLASPGNEGVVR